MRALRRFTVRAALPEPLAPLGELVDNLRWSWHPPTRDLLAGIAPEAWHRVGGDPVKLLGEVPAERLAELADDERFLTEMRLAHADLAGYLEQPRWYQSEPEAPASIAYFSPEYGITEVLPQYSGGLGILAGDHLKSASDLGVPLVGVGLFYRAGYFTQNLTEDGWQQERYPSLEPHGLPLTLLTRPDGHPSLITVGLPEGRTLHAKIWRAQVGRVTLLLLDSDLEENGPGERGVTDRLYGGGTEHRLMQELLLGIGGVRALRAWATTRGAYPVDTSRRGTGMRPPAAAPEVYHTNEGHAGFLGLERIAELTAAEQVDFDTALLAVRAGTVFTTHTPVPAGIDRFPRDMVGYFLGAACPTLPLDRLLALGAEADPNVFNMAHMGLRLAQRCNGVSTLHGEVSREMFAPLWPGFDADEVPITSVTNGVHAQTWLGWPIQDALTTRGADLTAGPVTVEQLDDAELWRLRGRMRTELVIEARRRLRAAHLDRGTPEAELGWVDSALDPDVLTIGFARRVPSYKRLTLMLDDAERLKRLLLEADRPIQVVIAGKAHPDDNGGKKLIQEMVWFADDPAVRHRIVFLPDYDIALARHLVAGCDVWLNNPLRPLEACGTSGMKAALNGCLNLSIADGWWHELADGHNGWTIPTANGVPDQARRDDLEASALYELLENGVVPLFYERDSAGVPTGWLRMVRRAYQTLGSKLLSSRMLRDYVERLYQPAAISSRALSRDGYAAAKALSTWRSRMSNGWGAVRVAHVHASGVGDTPRLGATLELHAEVELGELTPDDVTVQVCTGRPSSGLNGGELTDVRLQPMRYAERGNTSHRFEAEVPLERAGAFGYTVRVLPRHDLLENPVELGLVTYP